MYKSAVLVIRRTAPKATNPSGLVKQTQNSPRCGLWYLLWTALTLLTTCQTTGFRQHSYYFILQNHILDALDTTRSSTYQPGKHFLSMSLTSELVAIIGSVRLK